VVPGHLMVYMVCSRSPWAALRWAASPSQHLLLASSQPCFWVGLFSPLRRHKSLYSGSLSGVTLREASCDICILDGGGGVILYCAHGPKTKVAREPDHASLPVPLAPPAFCNRPCFVGSRAGDRLRGTPSGSFVLRGSLGALFPRRCPSSPVHTGTMDLHRGM